jgi:two-component system sensor histidine kinase VicK
VTCENDVAAVLRRAFPGLKGEGLEHLRAVACQRFYPPDAVVVREEEVGQSFFVILKGEVEVTKRLEGQARRLLQRHSSGDFFGEMALIEASSRMATVRTLTPSTLLEINKDEFESVLTQHPAMVLTVMRALTQRLRQADQRAISELSRENEELARVNRELTEQEQIRSEFLTTVAHELRTPLTSANGYLALVANGRMDGDQVQHAVNRALRNVKRVVKLVNDILFLQEIDLILPEFRAVSFKDIVSQTLAQHSQRIIETDVSLGVHMEKNLPQVMGDPEWLHRAVDALVDNAIKFSPNGGEISVRVMHRSGQVYLTIRDHGVGIPAEQFDRIFERFRRVKHMGPHLFGGVGLGLPLVKQVVEQHGGTIEVDSEEGQGSTFIVSLPAVS